MFCKEDVIEGLVVIPPVKTGGYKMIDVYTRCAWR
jgi:hypothetical protein